VHYPDNDLVDAARVIAWVDPVAGYGSRALAIGTRERTSAAPERVSGGAHWMENAHLRVEVDAHSGAIRLRAPESEFDVARLIAFEDVGDVGDLYTFSPVGGAERAATIEGLEVVHGGPLRAELCVRWRLEIPRRSTRTARSSRRVTIPIRTSLVLDAGASFLRVHVRGVNHARDHRLRVLFTTGVEQAALFADAAFGPVRREPILAPAESAESPPATAPLHRYVTLAGERRGATLYSDGLAEYEAMSNGEIAVTLVRAVGELSRNDLPERPGHAGWPTPTPGAQSLGPFAARFAIFPHGSRTDATVGRIERVADDVLLPLRGVTLRAALARPQPTRGVELEGDGLALSAIKESEDGAWTVLRCVNLLEREQRGRWRLGFPAREARVARLDETPQAPLAIEDGSIAFVAPPRGVVTVLVR
jgi:alpha-mannosidase